jgi:hypothetical protein
MSCLLRISRPVPRSIPTFSLASLGLLTAFCFSVPAQAAIDESVPTADGLAQLEQRARDANPREQCFLYTELIHSMTEKAGKEISEGESDQAASTLKKVNQYAHLIQMNLARNTKKIKDAQMLMHHTTYRLAQYLHLVSDDDKQEVQDTLKQLNQVNEELLAQVFQH